MLLLTTNTHCACCHTCGGIAKAWDVVKREDEYLTDKKTGIVQAPPRASGMDAFRRDYLKVTVTLGIRALPGRAGQRVNVG